MLTRSLLALALVIPSVAWAQEETSLLPDDAELLVGVDARTLYGDETFEGFMDLVEASQSYLDHAAVIDAWGFDPRSDVRELVFAVDRAGAPDAEFVVIVTGEADEDIVRARIAEHAGVTSERGPLGVTWTDEGGTRYTMTSTVGVIGVGALFDRTVQAVSDGAAVATLGGPATVWLHFEPSDAVRAEHPSLVGLAALDASLEVDATPAIRLRARMTSVEAAASGMDELRRLLASVSEVPEVAALGLEPLVQGANVQVEGTTVTLDAEMSAAGWADISDTLSELIAEELR